VRELLKSQDAHWSLVSGFFAAPLALCAQEDDVLDPRRQDLQLRIAAPPPWMWPSPNTIGTSPARSEGRVGTKCTTLKSATDEKRPAAIISRFSRRIPARPTTPPAALP
jgi:hypothetical protein